MLLMLCSCDSEAVKQAKEAYANGDYAKVVELLSSEEELSEEAQDMLAVSEANIAFEKKEYLDAVKKLASSSEGLQAERFEEMFTAALDDAIANKDVDAVVELLAIDESKADAVYEAVTKTCEEKDYNGFLMLESLVEKLPDGDLKTKLSDYDKEHDILKAEAFMVGTWTWKSSDGEKPSKVKVIPYDKNLVGRLVKIGTFLKDYHYNKDDVYWQDFEFENGKKFICNNLTRYSDGTAEGVTTTGKINYKKGTIELNVTGANNPNRTWKRVNK